MPVRLTCFADYNWTELGISWKFEITFFASKYMVEQLLLLALKRKNKSTRMVQQLYKSPLFYKTLKKISHRLRSKVTNWHIKHKYSQWSNGRHFGFTTFFDDCGWCYCCCYASVTVILLVVSVSFTLRSNRTKRIFTGGEVAFTLTF